MTEWRWISVAVIYAIHDRQIAEHGGLDGLRDQVAVESAISRPMNQFLYAKPDAADLAAAYAYGLARNHGFMDGNKRTVWVAARLFLAYNGHSLRFNPIEAVQTVEALAAGNIEEKQLAEWFRERLTPTP